MTEDHRIQEAGPTAPPEPERPPLTRAEHHRVVAGVCGGLGRHLDIDPVVFRVVTVVLCLSGGLGLFLYGLAWLIVPIEGDGGGRGPGGRTELQRVLTGRVDGQSIGAVLLTVIGTGAFFSSMGDGDQLFPLLLLGGLVFMAVRYDPERRRGRGRGRRHGGPYDRSFPEADGYGWPQDEAALRARHAADRAAGTVPADSPPPGPSGYLWDPRHPERNPYGGTDPGTATPAYGTKLPPPGGPTQAWWQRTDLPEGDPLRKEPRERRREPAAVRHPKERSPLGFFGFLLAVGAATAVWSASAGHSDVTRLSTVVLATGLLVIGLTLLLAAKFGKARKLAVLGLLTTLALAFAGHSPHTVQDAIGDRTWTVAAPAELRDRYNLGAGDLRLDLSGLDPAGTTVSTKVDLGAGELLVTLPPNVEANVVARVGLGSVTAPGGRNDGTGRHTYQFGPAGGQPSKGTIDLQLSLGIGDIKVVQQ
ncbi:PspC domain-containing protein [Kitasatospora sp. NPDC089797]|uniref:PspC domain-containing protein n=1 Tax=Kitasatospora sp. NPDC089797 TaxID=3155298 RepID=UPI0034181EAD